MNAALDIANAALVTANTGTNPGVHGTRTCECSTRHRERSAQESIIQPVRTYECGIRHHESCIRTRDVSALSSIMWKECPCCRACQQSPSNSESNTSKTVPTGKKRGEVLTAEIRRLAAGRWKLAAGGLL